MVIYYSLGGKTKTYAEKLADALGDKTFRLEGVSKSKNVVLAAFMGIVTGGKVKNLPAIEGENLYVCSPIWAAKPSPFVAYFLKNVNLSDKKVNFVFTCADADPAKYESELEETLSKYSGKVWVFCSQDMDAVDANVQSVVS